MTKKIPLQFFYCILIAIGVIIELIISLVPTNCYGENLFSALFIILILAFILIIFKLKYQKSQTRGLLGYFIVGIIIIIALPLIHNVLIYCPGAP